MTNELTPAQESRLREIRAREVQQIGLARTRLNGLKERHGALGRSLRGIDADIAADEAALAVERRPGPRANIQARLKERKVAKEHTQGEMDMLNRQAGSIIAAVRKELARLKAMNRIEAERIRNAPPAEATRKLDMTGISKAFGMHGEMSRTEEMGSYETISFRGVTWEGFGEIPTDNLTPRDIPYYMDRQDAAFSVGLETLKTTFSLTEGKRREAIDLYRDTGDPELKVAIEMREARFQAMKREVYQLREIGVKSTKVAEAREPNRPAPGYRPPRSPYPPGYVQKGHGNPPTLRSKHDAPQFPVRDSHLDQYIPRIRQLNDEAGQLAREYDRMRPQQAAQRGFDERNANEVYAMDKLPTAFDQYTTPAGYRPPPPGTGILVPMHAKEQDVTLSDLGLQSSGDLNKPLSHPIMGTIDEAVETMGALIPIQVEKPIAPRDRRSADEILADALKGLSSFEEAH